MVTALTFPLGGQSLLTWLLASDTPAPTLTYTPTPTTFPTLPGPAIPSLTPTIPLSPAPTSTSTSSPVRDNLIPLQEYANDNILNIIPGFPTSYQKWGEVSLFVPLGNNKISSQCSESFPNWPSEITISTNEIIHPVSIHLLINAGNTAGYLDKKIGVVELSFLEGQPLSYDLVLGENIREWRIKSGTVDVAFSDDLLEVYRGQSYAGDVSVIDMLTLNIPEGYRNSTLQAITLRDITQDTVSSADPCFFIIALTVKARN